MKTCTIDGCDREQDCKGLCHMHYLRTRKRTPDKPKLVACVVCGKKTLRYVGGGRKFGRTCSIECRARLQHGWSEPLPADHWARMWGKTCEWKAPRAEHAAFQMGRCHECDSLVCEPTGQTPSTYCSERCATRVARRRRRAREHNAGGSFRYSEIMRFYRLQGRVCAYCERPVIGLPDPEHVLPLSRGGRNDATNLVAACRMCNADKSDLTLSEWAEDRARRKLPPVRTQLDVTTKAFRHLVMREPTQPAWRDRAAA